MAIKYLSKTLPARLRGTALLRLDFNTEDDWRMKAVIPTIKLLLKTSSKIVIISHRGRPRRFDRKFSLKKDAPMLGALLGKNVDFVDHFRIPEIKREIIGAFKGRGKERY